MKNNVAMFVRCESKPINENISNEESVVQIAKAGFDKVFLSFQNDHLNNEFEKYLKLCKDNKLEIIFVHLGYRTSPGIATIWEEGKEGDTLVSDYKKDLDIMAKHNLTLAVMHVTKGSKQSPMSQIGIKRWTEFIDYAKDLGICIALENTVWPDYLEVIYDNIKNPNLTFCYDSGHDHAHFKDAYDFEKLGKKISCIHLHDNDGNADQHLLPFDGNINWDKLIKRLKNNNYKGVITGEMVYQKKYTNDSPENFFKECFNRLNEIDKKLN